MKTILETDANGDIYGLYTDEINLFNIGRVTDVRKASNVEFNEVKQVWEVLSLCGEVLYTHISREKAIEWEIGAMSPGGQYSDF